MKTFSERVSVDRDQAVEKTFVLYSSTFGYSQAMKKMKEVGLIEPDALSALEGTELYQRQYKTPDPYWAKMVCKDWDPKPTKWVIGEYFREEVKHSVDDSEEYGLVFECKKKRQNRAELCQKIREKLGEMGIKARVAQRGESTSVVVTPAAGSVQEVVGFCQMMLRIPENMTYVFGGDDIVGKCVAGKGNIGICGKEVAANMTHTGDQVFVSEKNGMDALMEGVMYHAIF